MEVWRRDRDDNRLSGYAIESKRLALFMREDEREKGGEKWWLMEGVRNIGDRIKDGFETIIAFYKQERGEGERISFENF